MALEQSIQAATRALSSYWPLTRFIASNPRWDQIDESLHVLIQKEGPDSLCASLEFYRSHFGERIKERHLTQAMLRVCGQQSQIDVRKLREALFDPHFKPDAVSSILFVDHAPDYQHHNARQWLEDQAFEWLLAFFGLGKSDSDLFTFWLKHAKRAYKETESWPSFDNAQSCLSFLLEELGIDKNNQDTYLAQAVMSLYGWGSLLKWKAKHPYVPCDLPEADIPQMLVIWLSLEWVIKERTGALYPSGLGVPDPFSPLTANVYLIWQTAYELAYQEPLLSDLSQATLPTSSARAKAQFVFCIDVRSEAIRRHIERQGRYETFGFAGFFGFAFSLDGTSQRTLQCPAIVEPNLLIKQGEKTASLFQQVYQPFSRSVSAFSNSNLGAFQLFELFGFWSFTKLLFKTLAPGFLRSKPSLPKLDLSTDNAKAGSTHLSLDSAVESALGFLKTINLTQDFSPYVILCGHASTTDNNPFAAALNCGACGGNSGLPNAVVACEVLNHRKVREQLRERGVLIPQKTLFVPACHETVTDEIQLFDAVLNPEIKADLKLATQNCQLERRQTLPGRRKTKTRMFDWSELVPELGLANNAAIIIGPRAYTQSLNLDSRAFLHSYHSEEDEDGSILENILLAPVLVAHWINAQYYFSSICPEKYGAGSKAIQNVVPGIGVILGNLSDLKVGLPEQSIKYRGELLHEPMRLLVVVYTPAKRLEALIEKHAVLKNLQKGGWVRFEAIEPLA